MSTKKGQLKGLQLYNENLTTNATGREVEEMLENIKDNYQLCDNSKSSPLRKGSKLQLFSNVNNIKIVRGASNHECYETRSYVTIGDSSYVEQPIKRTPAKPNKKLSNIIGYMRQKMAHDKNSLLDVKIGD